MRISIQINKLFIIWRKLWIRYVTLCKLDLVTISKCITKPYWCMLYVPVASRCSLPFGCCIFDWRLC